MNLTLQQAATQPATIKRGLIAGLIVGTVLCLINQWGPITAGFIGVSWLKVGLTYLIPFCVSTFSTAACKVDFDRESSEA
ncbi:MAG: hypothetical protein ACJAX5_000982 [Patiriisocius sp.]|jgi:hypothetical protein